MSDLDFKVLLEDLGKDAEQWDKVARALGKAVRIVDKVCGVARFSFEGLSSAQGVPRVYGSNVDEFRSYLNSGQKYIESLGEILRTTKANYSDSEEFNEWNQNHG